VTLGLAGLGAAAVLAVVHPGQPQFQDRNLVIRWTGAPGMSLPELDRLAAQTSQQLTVLPAVADVAATVGRAVSSDQIVSTNSAEIWVTIKPGAAYDRAVGQVRAIADGMPGVAGTVGTYESDSMGGVLARVSVAAEPADITHDAMSPYVDVTARLTGRDLGSARAAVAAGLRGISFPLSYYAAGPAPSSAAPADQAVFGWRLASYVIA